MEEAEEQGLEVEVVEVEEEEEVVVVEEEEEVRLLSS